jgi:hypothetical protein
MTKYNLQVVEAKDTAGGFKKLRLDGHAGQMLYAYATDNGRVIVIRSKSLRDGNVRSPCAVYHPHLVAAVEAAVEAYFAQQAQEA